MSVKNLVLAAVRRIQTKAGRKVPVPGNRQRVAGEQRIRYGNVLFREEGYDYWIVKLGHLD